MDGQLPARLFTLRAIERIVVLVIGAFTIFLGFYLFLKIPEAAKTEGQLSLPGGFSLVWANAGPGVFFVALGTAILGYALRAKVKWDERAVKESGRTATTPGASASAGLSTAPERVATSVVASYLSSTGRVVDEQAKRGARDSLRRDLRLLDRLAEMAGSGTGDTVSVPRRRLLDLNNAVPRIKANLMFTVWDKDWGEYAAFQRWIREGAPEPPPNGIIEPAKYLLDRDRDEP